MPAKKTAFENSDLDEDIRDFGRRFARIVISRGFRNSADSVQCNTAAQRGQNIRSSPGELACLGKAGSAIGKPPSDADVGLRASQILVQQLQADADAMHVRVLPSLRENARHLEALFVAIDKASDEVMPEIEEAIVRMEKAMYRMEEKRKEQVETQSLSGSYGLGSPWGAGLWVPPTGDDTWSLPDIYETDKMFHAKSGGLAPL